MDVSYNSDIKVLPQANNYNLEFWALILFMLKVQLGFDGLLDTQMYTAKKKSFS